MPVPVPYANLTNPQTLNLYAMVADDPESFADLDGHFGSVYDNVRFFLCGNMIADPNCMDVNTKEKARREGDKAAQSAAQNKPKPHLSKRDKAYLDKYYKPMAAKAKEYGVNPALPLGLAGESGFASKGMYLWTGDAFGMTGGSTANPVRAKSPEDDVNKLFANFGEQMRGTGSDTMLFLHRLEQEDANGNQITANGMYNSVEIPPTTWIESAKSWIGQMQRDIPIYLSQP